MEGDSMMRRQDGVRSEGCQQADEWETGMNEGAKAGLPWELNGF